MAAALIHPPAALATEQTVTVLVVSPSEDDHALLESIFDHYNCKIHGARTCREALAFLRENPMPVLICECCLPDGKWKDILNAVASMIDPPRLIVSSRHADDCLWAEVLNLGGYDVLMKPFDTKEVSRVVSLAWQHWKDDRRRTNPNNNARVQHEAPAHNIV